MLIAARYDQHANITIPQSDALNIITILRTAHYRDYVSRFHDALRLLVTMQFAISKSLSQPIYVFLC